MGILFRQSETLVNEQTRMVREAPVSMIQHVYTVIPSRTRAADCEPEPPGAPLLALEVAADFEILLAAAWATLFRLSAISSLALSAA